MFPGTEGGDDDDEVGEDIEPGSLTQHLEKANTHGLDSKVLNDEGQNPTYFESIDRPHKKPSILNPNP